MCFPAFAVDREGILTARVYLVTEVKDEALPSSLFYSYDQYLKTL